MHSTSPSAVNGTPENQRTAAIGADESVRPKSWSYMHRAKWARSLPVKSGARLTAIAIADHINEKTGWWDLSAAQMADETGQGERTVRRHVNEDLRPYFGVQDRPGFMWRFTMPAPLMAVVEPRPNRPDPPAKLADVPSDLPSNVHTQGGRERLTCEKHNRFWPRSCGEDCYECAKDRQHAPTHQHVPKRRMAKAQLPRAYDDEGWFQECTRLHAGRCNGSRGHGLTMQDAEYWADETRRAARGES